MEPWVRVILLILAVCLNRVFSAIPLMSEDAGPPIGTSPPIAEQQLSLSGWFHVIWNGEPRYMLIDDQGRWTEMLVSASLTRPFGGPLALNQKRVKIVGEGVSAPPGAVRVLSIEVELEKR